MLSSFLYAKKFETGQWSFLGPGSEKKWYSTCDSRLQGESDRVAELMIIEFGESGHPDFRATSPLSRRTLRNKGGGQLTIHLCADEGTIQTVFRTTISFHLLSIYGAIADIFEKCDTCPDRRGRHAVERKSTPFFLPSVMKTHILVTDDPAQEE